MEAEKSADRKGDMIDEKGKNFSGWYDFSIRY